LTLQWRLLLCEWNPRKKVTTGFMQVVVEAGFISAQEMKILNCFCCHQEVIYLLDVFDVGGRCLDRRYLDQQKKDEKWLTLIFPQVNPPQGHLQLWRECLYSRAPLGRPTEKVGDFESKEYKIWDWCYDEEASKVYHHKGHVMDIYTPSLVPGYTRCPNCWRCGACLSASKNDAVNLILRLFLYHFLHTMSL
jgi:hypothetical protein